MKAVTYSEFGAPEVLHLTEVATPRVGDHDVLVRVHAANVNFGDRIARDLRNVSPGEFHMPFLFWVAARVSFGLRTPAHPILGNDYAGVVEQVGAKVTRFQPGDEVFGYRGQRMGAYAEFLSVAETDVVAIKPANMTFEEAATVPYGAMVAGSLLRKLGVRSGQRVLILGASGSIGSAAVQVAKYFGAEVTGVCSAPRLGLVKALGADRVVDYTTQDFASRGEKYDLIVDVLGTGSFAHARSALFTDGVYLYVSFKLKQLLQMLWTKVVGGPRVVCGVSGQTLDDLLFVKRLIEDGHYRAVVDKRFPMAQAADAHRYAEAGKKAGGVVITAP